MVRRRPLAFAGQRLAYRRRGKGQPLLGVLDAALHASGPGGRGLSLRLLLQAEDHRAEAARYPDTTPRTGPERVSRRTPAQRGGAGRTPGTRGSKAAAAWLPRF